MTPALAGPTSASPTGTQAAKEAGNMVDLDSNPEAHRGRQSASSCRSRGALTTFSIATDVASTSPSSRRCSSP
jgi:high-affinity K+ transport system ATPase subunit B